jgi:hypothetical protein
MKIKQAVTHFFTIIAAGGMLFFSACTKDDDLQPDDPSGDQSQFAGNWSVSETSKIYGVSTYNASIADSSNTNYVLISYIYGFHTKTRATVSGNSLTISSQVIEGNQVSGSGTLENARRLSLKYYVKISSKQTDTVTATFTK